MLLAAGARLTGEPPRMADVFANLCFNAARHDSKDPLGRSRPHRAINGHICAILYSALAEAGYLPKDELKTFRKLDSRLQGHPARMDLPGVETSAGSLGQGIGVAVGMAMAAKLDGKNHTVFALMGDGELNEGSCWEAFLNAHKFKLDNLLVMVDRNDIQIDGYGHDVLPLEPLSDKFKAFGFDVFQADGNDMAVVVATTEKALKTKNGKPRVIPVEDRHGQRRRLHAELAQMARHPPNAEQAAEALKQLESERARIEDEKA